MKKLLITILCTISVSAFATDSGAYVGFNIGFGNVDALSNLDLGVNVNGGYQFNRYLSLEGDYTYFASADVWGSTSKYTTTGNVTYLLGAVKGTLPLSSKVSLYGKAGLGFAYSATSSVVFANGSTTAFTPASLLGVGVQYELKPSLAINLEDMNYINSNINGLGNASLIGVGLSYHF